MSEDFDDLGGYNTPVIQTKPRGSRSQVNKTAGPSKPGPRTKHKPVEAHPEIIDLDDAQDEEDELGSTAPPPTARRNQPSVVNKPKPNKGKGKAKAPPQRSNQQVEEAEDNDVEMLGNLAQGSEAEFNAVTSPSKKVVRGTGDAALRKQCDELEKRLKREIKYREEAEKRCDELTNQLEKIMRVRETEAEALMIASKQQSDARIEALEKLNAELTSALAKAQPLAGSGKGSILHLLTREAADEEKRQIEQEATKWRQKLENAEEVIKEKEQIEKELNYELEVEKRNFQTMLKKERQGAVQRPRGDILGTDKPQTVQLVQFYEDCTNLLVVRMKAEPGSYLGLDDWHLGCVFTYVGESVSDDPNVGNSLSFNLTARWEKREDGTDSPVNSKEDLQEMMYYEPLELEKATDEFINDLGHMGSAFSFTRDQMALFLRTLYNTFDEVLNKGQGDEDDEVQMIE